MWRNNDSGLKDACTRKREQQCYQVERILVRHVAHRRRPEVLQSDNIVKETTNSYTKPTSHESSRLYTEYNVAR